MVQTDASGQGFSYLGSEEKFAFLKELERKNLVVPVVGNFSGPKALRAVGAYLKSRQTTVTAFYLSNVEQYLQRGGTWTEFCANVATFPTDENSVFIRPSNIGSSGTSPQTLQQAISARTGVAAGPNATIQRTPWAYLMPIVREVIEHSCGGR